MSHPHSTAGDSASHPPVHFGRTELREHRHICAFFHTPEEEDEVMVPFFREGIEAGEQALCIVDGRESESYRSRLERGGIDVKRAESGGQLSCPTWDQTYLATGRFNPAAMGEVIRQVIDTRARRGYKRGRFAGHMEWSTTGDEQTTRDLIEYECRLNQVLPDHPDAVVCLYQVGKFDGSVIMDVLRTHPLAMVGGVVYENPFYVPPEQFLEQLEQRHRGSAAH